MDYSVLYVILTLKEEPEVFPAQGYRYNEEEGGNELLITVFGQSIWVSAQAVKLRKVTGSAFCWKEYEQEQYVELNQNNTVCPVCGWWRCHACDSCRCNRPGNTKAD